MPIAIRSCVSVLLGLCVLCEARADSRYERPPLMWSASVVPEALRKGPYHEIAPQVTSDGYFNNYFVKSQFGDFYVEGQQLLEIRIGELNALAELDKLSSSKVFGDALVKSGKAAVMAPVHAVKKVAQTVSDPDKMVETLQAVPEGAERLFSWAYKQVKGAAHAAADLVSSDSEKESDPKDKEDESSDSDEDKSSSTLKSGKSFGLRYLGYTKRERELFRKLHVSPYTSNQTLQDEVVRVAGIETAVGFAFKFIPSVALLSQIGTFNTWYGRAEKLSLYEDPAVIREKNKAELRELGASDQLAGEFQKNSAYTPWTRRFVVASLTALGPSVEGRALFIQSACLAKNEPTSLYFVSVAEHLERVSKETPLKRVVSSLFIPAVVTKKGVLYVPLSVDYLFWTEEIASIFADFKKRVQSEEKFSGVEIHIRGKASPLARKELKALGAKVFENSWS